MRTQRSRGPRRRYVLLAGGVATGVLLGLGGGSVGGSALAAVPTPGAPVGLPRVASGHRPGPDILYAPAPRAPQLENTGPWTAAPILVSGATAYRQGEFLYQDFLYDDHGATGSIDDKAVYGPSGFLFAPTGGTFTYPTNPVYANNAADLVEFRLKALPTETAFRITLNSLKDPSLVGFTVALGDSAAQVKWPFGAGVTSPSRYFLTVHGREASLLDSVTGSTLTPWPKVTVDLLRRQFDVRIPHAAWNPGRSRVRVTVGVGLWNPGAGTYLKPGTGEATATTPGGGAATGVAIVNVGPRLNEPFPKVRGGGYTLADTAVLGMAQAAMWRERQQSQQLALGNVSPFASTVDFGKLSAGVTDDSGVPTSGPINRILASHYAFGQGVDPTRVCYDLPTQFASGAKCVGRFVGQLQPYAVYLPHKPAPVKGYGLTLLLHSLSANYNQYSASNNQSQLAERGTGSVVVTPAGRGPDGFYAGLPEADTFEVWADVARHYPLDRDYTDVSGYSMGGFGTYRLLARWPDLFARGFSVVGAPGSVGGQLISLRNTPLLSWNATADELVNLKTSQDAVAALVAAGAPFTEDLFVNADHLTLAVNDQFQPGADFLGSYRVDRNPSAVSYVVNPVEDSALAQTVADHAYWISGLRTRGAGLGSVIAYVPSQYACGCVVARPGTAVNGGGVLLGGAYVLGYLSETNSLLAGAASAQPKLNKLVVTVTNLRAGTIDLRRAGVTCAAPVEVNSDGPVTLTFAGCGRTARVGAGTHTVR